MSVGKLRTKTNKMLKEYDHIINHKSKSRKIKSNKYIYYKSNSLNRVMSYSQTIFDKCFLNTPNIDKKKYSIVFDIDDTLLVTDIQKKGQYYDMKVNQPVFDFYNYVLKHGINVFLITARPVSTKKETIKELNDNQIFKKSRGIPGYTKLLMYNKRYENDFNKSRSKFDNRSSIIKNGYTIIMNFGDLFSDLFLLFPFTGMLKIKNSNLFMEQYNDILQTKHKYIIFTPPDKTSIFAIKLCSNEYD